MVDWVAKCKQLGVGITVSDTGVRYVLEFPNGYTVWCPEEHQVREELEDWKNGNGCDCYLPQRKTKE